MNCATFPMRKFSFLRSLITAPAVALLIGGPFAASTRPAQARWNAAYANLPYRAWYAQQHDGKGWSCCIRGDAHAIYDAFVKYGKWHVKIDGVDHEIQPYQLLNGPNPTGHAVLWFAGSGNHVTIFCFAPGALY